MSDTMVTAPVSAEIRVGEPEGGLSVPGDSLRHRLARLRRYLLDVPLLYKILLADAGIIFLIGLLGVGVVAQAMDITPTQPLLLFWIAAGAGVILTVPVRLYILRRTLAPIEILQDAAERVEAGDLTVRAAQVPLSDPRLARLTDVFNRVLDAVLADRGRLQEIAAKAFRAQEAERERIARELHEEIAQTMTTLLLRVRLIRGTADEAVRGEALDELRGDLVSTMDAVREFARGLHPPALHDLGLLAAIEGYARTLQIPNEMSIHIEAVGPQGTLSAERELALFRIAQEALSNTVRHAHATETWLVTSLDHDELVLEVSDNGRGFDVEAAEDQQRSLGLFGMRERALYVGGSVRIESTPGRGTRLIARMPVST